MITNKVSVIIPVYNVENYVLKCLNSIVNQSYQNLQIIIVNDGSTDHGPALVQEFMNQHSQEFVYISQENQGLSAARNAGLKQATGEYICFVDSDDWLEEDYVKDMLCKIKADHSDMCMCAYKRTTGVEHTVHQLQTEGIFHVENMEDKFKYYITAFIEKKNGIIAWNKLYRADVLRLVTQGFEPNAEIYAEDLLFNFRFLMKCNKISNIDKANYCYYIRENSTVTSEKKRFSERYSELNKRMFDVLCDHSACNTYFKSLVLYEALNVVSAENEVYKKGFSFNYRTTKLLLQNEVIKKEGFSCLRKQCVQTLFARKDIKLFLFFLSFFKQPFIVSLLFFLKQKITGHKA